MSLRPLPDSCSAAKNPSFDQVVSPHEHDRRHVDAERLRGLDVDYSLVLDRRLHRQVGGLLALEDAIDAARGAPVHVDDVDAVGREASLGDEEAERIDRRQAVLR